MILLKLQISIEAKSELSNRPPVSWEPSLTCSDRFDSSKNRGDFKTEIGIGKVIKGAQAASKPFEETHTNESVLLGWDEGLTDMTLGEKSVLIIPG